MLQKEINKLYVIIVTRSYLTNTGSDNILQLLYEPSACVAWVLIEEYW